MAKKQNYSFWVGLLKTIKNILIVLGPALLAFLANVPAEYAWIAGGLAYMLKNFLENRN